VIAYRLVKYTPESFNGKMADSMNLRKGVVKMVGPWYFYFSTTCIYGMTEWSEVVYANMCRVLFCSNS